MFSCYKSFCLLVILSLMGLLDYTRVYNHWMLEIDKEWGPGPAMVSLAHWAPGVCVGLRGQNDVMITRYKMSCLNFKVQSNLNWVELM